MIKQKFKRIVNVIRVAPLIAISSISASPSVYAAGFIQTIRNLIDLSKAGTLLLIALGVLGGLGSICYGLFQLVKKGDQRGEDITWMSIALKIFAGAALLALTWVGSSGVETLGGSAADVGRPIQ